MPKDLFIDIETYSSVDIKDCGAYKYIASPDFEILIVGYAIDEGPVQIIDLLQGESLPDEFIEALHDPNCKKHAHNATFERLSFKRIGHDIPPAQWHCTAVKSAYCGLPISLDQVSKVLDLRDKKLDTGKLLIKYFSCPCKPTKINGGRTRNYPEHAPEKWEMYKEYNKYDVLAEREIHNLLKGYEVPEFERQMYVLDQEINDRGIMIDRELAEQAIRIDDVSTEQLTQEAIALTGLSNPNSGTQLRDWIEQRTGIPVDSLSKEALPELYDTFENDADVIKLLDIRKKLSKTSVKKYYAMINCATSDNRVRGTFQFYGASRTGRWAGRLLQLQNLSKNHFDNIDLPRELCKLGDMDLIDTLYGDVPDVLSQLVRTAIIAPEGHTLSVADFSAIEARVISWCAQEEWRMEVFRGDGKIYEATGAKMFGVPISAIKKGSPLRDKSKISELALGYEGSLNALKRMGGERMGLSDAEMQGLVRKWRDANPKIVKMWTEFQECAHDAVRYHKRIKSSIRGIIFAYDGLYLTVQLPSGRKLFYYKPKFHKKEGMRGAESLCYQGVVQATRQWGLIDTYGGKLTENIVQAIARDLLGYAMLQLRKAGYKIVMHVHDEVIAEIPCDGKEKETYNEMVRIMSTPPEWAKDLPLNADGYITPFYKKD